VKKCKGCEDKAKNWNGRNRKQKESQTQRTWLFNDAVTAPVASNDWMIDES
jgi:hypothetical protein